MKDIPHHMNKINKKVIRSTHHEGEDPFAPPIPNLPQTEQQKKKQKKQALKKAKQEETPHHLNADEKNRQMRKRSPIFEPMSHASYKRSQRPRGK